MNQAAKKSANSSVLALLLLRDDADPRPAAHLLIT
jgi:hypothetical protein